MSGIPTDAKSRRTFRALSALLLAWWRRRVPFLISPGLTAFALFIYSCTFIGDQPTAIFSFINRLELDTLDFRFRVRPESYRKPDPRILIVDIERIEMFSQGAHLLPGAPLAGCTDSI